MLILKEDDNKELTQEMPDENGVYVDTETGKRYEWDPEKNKFVPEGTKNPPQPPQGPPEGPPQGPGQGPEIPGGDGPVTPGNVPGGKGGKGDGPGGYWYANDLRRNKKEKGKKGEEGEEPGGEQGNKPSKELGRAGGQEDAEDDITRQKSWKDDVLGRKHGDWSKEFGSFRDDEGESDEERQKFLDAEEAARQKDLWDESEEDKEDRLVHIQKILNGEEDVMDDIAKDDEIAQRREYDPNYGKPKIEPSEYLRFENEFEGFIKEQIKRRYEDTYKRLNKKYAGTKVLKKGHRLSKDFEPIRLQLYFDVSGSFSEDMLQVSEKVRHIIEDYQKRGEVVAEQIPFDNSLYPAHWGGGTSMYPIIDHIDATKPDNVIVITDDYFDGLPSKKVTVPGGVWFLWVNGGDSSEENSIASYLRGASITSQFDITDEYKEIENGEDD